MSYKTFVDAMFTPKRNLKLSPKDLKIQETAEHVIPRSSLVLSQNTGRAGSNQAQLKNLISAQVTHNYRKNRVKHSSIDITEHRGSSALVASGNFNESLSPDQKKTINVEQKSGLNAETTAVNFRSKRLHQKSTIEQPAIQSFADNPLEVSTPGKQVTTMIMGNGKNTQSLTLNSPNFQIKTNSQHYPKTSTIDASYDRSKQNLVDRMPIFSPTFAQKSVLIWNENNLQEIHKESMEKIQHQKNTPGDPLAILNKHAKHLSPFERNEIANYKEIYYFGQNVVKIEAAKEQDYEDERNDYKAVRKDHIAYRYEILDILGKGSFGQVLKVLDHKTNEEKALKIIRNQPKFHFQARIEIKILKFMQEKHCSDYNIIEMNDSFIFRGHQCLIFDILSMNLYEFLKANKFKGLSVSLIRRMALQILYALRFMRKYNIIHCDLKPENILLRHPDKSGIRVIDFGSSCFGSEKLYTYIQSRFYRSPEIILGLGYDTQIDMWSFGCLLFELFTGFPLFPGESEADQLGCIMEIIGKPPPELLQRAQKRKNFFEEDLNPKIIPNSRGKIRIPGSVTITSVIGRVDKEFLDLILRCLVYDPTQRITPEEALCHSWILQGLPENLQAQHLKIIQKEGTQKAIEIISDSSKRETKENLISAEELKQTKQASGIIQSNDDSDVDKKKDLKPKLTNNLIGQDEQEPVGASIWSKHKSNSQQNSALFIDSQNTNDSIDYKAHQKHPVSTKNSSINIIKNIYYIGQIGIGSSRLSKKPLSGARTPKKTTFVYHSTHNSQDNIEAVYHQHFSYKRDKSLSIEKKPKNTLTHKDPLANLTLTVNKKPYIAYRKLAKPNALFPDIKKA